MFLDKRLFFYLLRILCALIFMVFIFSLLLLICLYIYIYIYIYINQVEEIRI